VGNNDGTPMDSIAGSSGAGQFGNPSWNTFYFNTYTNIQPIGGIMQEKVCKAKKA